MERREPFVISLKALPNRTGHGYEEEVGVQAQTHCSERSASSKNGRCKDLFSCNRVPSGHAGGAIEKFGCNESARSSLGDVAPAAPCTMLLAALGWERVCELWNAHYMCESTGHHQISLTKTSVGESKSTPKIFGVVRSSA